MPNQNLVPTALILVLMATQATALMPYTRSIWDTMLSTEDPYKILEQTPLPISKGMMDTTLALARADWKETPTAHIITLDVPGMKKEEIKIEVEDRVLRISGERKELEEKEGEKWHRAERTNGKFWRQFRLPGNADLEHVKAHLEDGLLRIVVPKIAEEKKRNTKVIDISGQEGASGEDIKAIKS